MSEILFSIRTWICVILFWVLLLMIYFLYQSNNRIAASKEYIKELESHINDNTMLDVITETDSYCEYYK